MQRPRFAALALPIATLPVATLPLATLPLATLLLGTLLLLLGCQVDRSAQPPAQAAAREVFGKPLSGLTKTPLAAILQRPAEFDGRTVAVEGHVARACSRKGCWMEIADGPSESAPSCRVTFENYAFFVPKDAPGAQARLEGTVTTSRIKPSHVEHLESEGARFGAKNPDGSAIEVQIVATGVELERARASSSSGNPG